jgi:hypothetical protein
LSGANSPLMASPQRSQVPIGMTIVWYSV